MNIQYIGATENSNYKRFAVIQHTEKEKIQAERFLLLLKQLYERSYFWEEEMLYIEVEDKEEFDYVKSCFKAYKKTKIFQRRSNRLLSYEEMYEEAESDAEMYCFLVNKQKTESEIKEIMLNVSGATDAYYHALEEISAEIF